MLTTSLRLRGLAATALALLASFGISSASAQTAFVGSDATPAIVGPDFLGYNVIRYFSGSPLSLTSPALITGFDVSITFSKIPDFPDDFPYYDEIGFDLLHFDGGGTLLGDYTLFSPGDFSPGVFGTYFDGTLEFSTDAWLPVNVDPDHLLPGLYAPVGPLSGDFSSYSTTDFFALGLTDATAGNPLIYSSSRLTVDVLPVPEPSTYAAAGAGILVVLITLRRRRAARAA